MKNGTILLLNEAGGKQSSGEIPFTGSLTGNEGIRRLTLKALLKAGDSISYQVFIPDFSQVFKATRKWIGTEAIALNGKTVQAIKVEDSYEGLPIVRLSWLDKDGYVLRSSEPNPFGQMTLVLADEVTAKAVAVGETGLSEDQYTATLVRSNIRLPQPRRIESVTLKIKQNSPGMGLPDFGGSYQKVGSKSSDEVVITVQQPVPGQISEPLSELSKKRIPGV